MSERSYLANGRFLQNIDQWTATNAAYSAGDGDDHYGVANLSAGGYITQTFAVPYARAYTLHTSVKPVGGVLTANQVTATITDGNGNTVVALSLEGATSSVWQENTDTLGLAPGATYTLKFTNGSALTVRLDDVWLWFVAITRAAIAAQVHARLGQLATDYSFSTTLSGALTEGSYTYAIDAGLRSLGAIDPETGEIDIRYLEIGDVATCIDLVEVEMLKRVQRSALTEVDTSLGPRSESLSQKAAMIGETLGNGGRGGGRVVIRPLRHEAEDYEFR
jgi:hypothetical protein